MVKKAKKTTVTTIKHILMPEHTKLSEKEKESFLKQYNVSEAQLPRILMSDPAIASLGCQLGDVVKIIRKGNTSGESIFYRVVING